MNIIDIITKKKNKGILSYDELKFAIDGYVSGNVADYQMSSLLMAICINKMTDEEVSNMTEIMMNSGDKIDLSKINGIKVDKHSTGGIGDKTTLVLAPLVASLGVVVPKMSGRGLGYTGGTIDKLESIENFKVSLTEEEFINEVNEIGCAVASQTGNLVPADKKIYALRDVSGTVDSKELIASSIMSKKLASGADKFVIDVKVGEGALMNNLKDAEELADLMIKIGSHHGKEVKCLLTNMNEPLGCAVGNGVEVVEAIETLKGNGPKDFEELVITLASYMINLSLKIDLDKAKIMAKENLYNGKAYDKFKQMVALQGGNINNITVSDKKMEIVSDKSGYLNNIEALKLAKLVKDLGAGRNKKEDLIDYGVGIVLNKKEGQYVEKGEKLLDIYYNKDFNVDEFKSCFNIEETKKDVNPLIYKIM